MTKGVHDRMNRAKRNLSSFPEAQTKLIFSRAQKVIVKLYGKGGCRFRKCATKSPPSCQFFLWKSKSVKSVSATGGVRLKNRAGHQSRRSRLVSRRYYCYMHRKGTHSLEVGCTNFSEKVCCWRLQAPKIFFFAGRLPSLHRSSWANLIWSLKKEHQTSTLTTDTVWRIMGLVDLNSQRWSSSTVFWWGFV